MLNSDYARLRILDAACELFGKIGYAATTTRMIAKEADVSLSAIPYHFSSKENLYKCVIQRASAQFTNYFAPIAKEITAFLHDGQSDPDTARDLLARLLSKHLEYVLDQSNEPQLRLFFQLHTYNQLTPDFNDMNMATTQLLSYLLAIIRPSLSPDDSLILAYSIIGEQLFFFYHKPSVLQRLGLKDYDPGSVKKIRRILLQKLQMMFPD